MIGHAPPEGDHDAGNDQDRCPDQTVKDQETEKGLDFEGGRRKSEEVNAIEVETVRNRSEFNPAPHQRKRDRCRNDAPPHDEPMPETSQTATAEDESIGRELEKHSPRELRGLSTDVPRAKK